MTVFQGYPSTAFTCNNTSLMMMMMMMDDAPSAVFLPCELIGEILSYLNVKTLMQLRSVSKAWKTLISNPTLVNLHLQKSHRNPHLALDWADEDGYYRDGSFCIPRYRLALFPVCRLLKNSSIIVVDNKYCCNVKMKHQYKIAGSYNGLFCSYGHAVTAPNDYVEYWLCLRNLAMGTKSENLGHFIDSDKAYSSSFKFSFGYDNSTGTYKVVAFRVDSQKHVEVSWRSEVMVFNLRDKYCRKIQSFLVAPLGCLEDWFGIEIGVHFIGTVNWITLSDTFVSSYDWKHINVEDFVILSLSLSTETYTRLLLPKGFNEVPRVQPTLRVLRNFLCFSHDFSGTEFVIWQMREFGVQESWTQLIKVSYQTLQMKNLRTDDHIYNIQLLPLYLFENSDTLIFADNEDDGIFADDEVIIYSWKDGRVE